MKIDKYKNVEEQEIILDKDLVVFGKNGVGKSNLCEVLAHNLIGEKYTQEVFSEEPENKLTNRVVYASAHRMFTRKDRSPRQQSIKLIDNLILESGEANYISNVTAIIECYYIYFDEYYKKLQNILKEIYPTFEYIDSADDKTIYDMSDGHKSISYLIILLLVADKLSEEWSIINNIKLKKIMIIDEIDLNVHFSIQRRIYKTLKNNFKDYRFVITTHSPVFISSVNSRDTKLCELKKGQLIEMESQFNNDIEDIFNDLFETPARNDEIEKELNKLKILYIKYLKEGDKQILAAIGELRKKKSILLDNMYIKNIITKVEQNEM